MEEKDKLNEITEKIIGAAINVHRALGPGLLESAYETCLAFELSAMGLKVEQQRALPVVYRKVKLDCGYRLDLVVEDKVVVELKAVDELAPIHSGTNAFVFEIIWFEGRFADKLSHKNVKRRSCSSCE